MAQKDPSPDNTPPPVPLTGPFLEAERLTKLLKGNELFVVSHTAFCQGVPFTTGGHVGKFSRITVLKDGNLYVSVYHDGERGYPIEYIRDFKRRPIIGVKESVDNHLSDAPDTHMKKGDVIIVCEGISGKKCGKTRAVHAADAHIVKRCKDCQKEFGKIATRLRMKQKREGKKNAKVKTKEVGGDSKPLPGKADKDKTPGKGKTGKS